MIALYAMLRAVEAGFQAALMAPTETLAEQHAATLDRLLADQRAERPVAGRAWLDPFHPADQRHTGRTAP